MPYQASDGWSCTRKCLVKIMGQYLAALAKNDSSDIPFANDQTQTPEEAAEDDFSEFRKMKCGEQMNTGIWDYITDITDRRILAIDEEKGLAFAFSIFRHSGVPKVIKITGVPGITERPNDYGAFDLPAAHIFKIWDGKIHEIETIGYMAEHGITNGWE